MATRRQRQLAELLHEEISTLLQRRAQDPRLKQVTVTGVEITKDLKIARVYVSVLGDAEETRSAMAGLEKAAGYLRSQLGASVRLRYVPELSFRLDDSLKQGMHIDQLLDALIVDDQPADTNANGEQSD
jgi:ribosome-binding factor A